ncbi:MAG: cytochrome C biogenesis protein [Pseudorhodoplanes sp.]|nr:cytochrome C biogenesis protein [Pseudorhodoplanes sp.]
MARPAHGAGPQATIGGGDSHSALRLLAARSRDENGSRIFRAGAEIALAPGWKTYWRYPGDSGIPPHFDFSGSENVKSATVLWPAPQRFSDVDGATIGYKTRVVFPIHVVATDPAKPVTLRLKLDYAICEKLCIPAEGKAAVALGKDAGENEAEVTAAESRVPRRVAVGAKPLSIRSVRREDASPPRVIVDVAVPAGETVELFAEGPTPEWALPLPEPVAGAAPGTQRFSFALDGLPSGASGRNVTLILTAVGREQAIETPAHLD